MHPPPLYWVHNWANADSCEIELMPPPNWLVVNAVMMTRISTARAIMTIMFIGSSIPFFMFVIWRGAVYKDFSAVALRFI